MKGFQKAFRFWVAAVAGMSATGALGVEYTLIPYSTAMTATGSSQYDDNRAYVYAIDGSGLTDLGNGEFTHTDVYTKAMWMAKSPAPSTTSPKFYCVDLGASYNLGRIKIWNYNQKDNLTRGFKTTEIYLSNEEDPARTTPAEIRAWGDAVWTGELSKATGSGDTGCSPISFHGRSARYVGIVATSNWGDSYAGLSEVRFFTVPAGVPDFSSTAVEVNSADDGFVARATTESDAQSAQVTALAYADSSSAPTSIAFDATVAPGVEATKALTGLTADTTYSILLEAANSVATVTNDESVIIYTGTPTLAFAEDGQEKGCVPAKVTVSRGSADPFPLTINYSLSSSDGEEGVDYETPSGTVTIPANATSTTIEVVPMVNPDKSSDVHVTVTLESGMYHVNGATGVPVAISNASIPDDANVWIAGSDSDGLASTASNWSKGMPRADSAESLVILVDGDYSSHDLVWDADGTTDLAATVTSWTQTAAYGGTVTFNTTYPAAASTFKTFTVTGAMTVNGGTVTHPRSATTTKGASVTLALMRSAYTYRLNLHAGSFILGDGAKIDLSGKGHYAEGLNLAPSHGGRYESTSIGCYGNVKYPEDLGVASNMGTDSASKWCAGGGAVKLVVDGACTINGEINVDGVVSSGNLAAGAAGSILIEAKSVTGSGTGVVHADGIYCKNSSYKNGAPGRVAVLTTDPVDMTTVTFSASGSSTGTYAPCGTVFVKDASMTYGVLYVRNRFSSMVNAAPNRGTFVTSEEGVDWTFDKIVLAGNAQLYVPTGTTLTLPNGFASIDASANTGTARPSGIFCTGGTINAGNGDQTLSGNWYFAPVTGHSFPANVTLANGAYIGFSTYFEQTLGAKAEPTTNAVMTIRCNVTGDMTVPSGCGFSTMTAGPVQQSGQQYTGVSIGSHGGRHAGEYTMGSVFNPMHAPVGQQNSYGYMKPGAAMIVNVGGKLTMNGTASANPVDSAGGGYGLAAAGSINFTVGELEGSGSFVAKGFRDNQNGGRIAVKLTKSGATFDHFTGTISAQTSSGATKSSSGSVYLQAGDEADHQGTIYLDNLGTKLTTPTTPICANGYAADEVADFKKANLVIRGGASAQVTAADDDGGFALRNLTMTSPASLDLYGRTLTVSRAKLGGTKLASGTYAAADTAVSDYVTDSVGGGKLVVTGGGLSIVVR